jgi:nitrogen fixation protein FixH
MTVQPAQTAISRGVKGRHVLWGMIGFFSVVVGVNGTMIYSAISTFGGLESANAYRDGLAYNQRIAADRLQSELGWRDSVEIRASPPRVRVSLLDRDGVPVRDLKLSASIGRPATDRFDTVLALQEVGPGTYETGLAGIDPGSWIVDVRASHTGNGAVLYQTRRRVWLKP